MIGIYKITNKINNKIYVGQSQDIKRRWKSHISNAGKYNTLISLALKKYGIENFNFEILEECNIEELDKKEQYWIDRLNSLSPNGYNCIPVNGVLSGEDNPNNKYSTDFIYNIRRRVFIDKEKAKEVYQDYCNILDRTYFYKILHGDFRKEKGSGIELVESLVDHKGSNNSRSTITEKDVLNIRKRIYINKESNNIVWQDYKDVISWEAFLKVATGQTWTHVDCSMICEIKINKLNKPKVKLNEEQVQDIRYKYEKLNKTITEIFKEYSSLVTKVTIKRIVNYETWKNVKPVSTIPEA